MIAARFKRPPVLPVRRIASSQHLRAIRKLGLLRVRLERRTVARIAGSGALIRRFVILMGVAVALGVLLRGLVDTFRN